MQTVSSHIPHVIATGTVFPLRINVSGKFRLRIRSYLMVAAKFSFELPSQTWRARSMPNSAAVPVREPPINCNGTLMSFELGPEIFCYMSTNIDANTRGYRQIWDVAPIRDPDGSFNSLMESLQMTLTWEGKVTFWKFIKSYVAVSWGR